MLLDGFVSIQAKHQTPLKSSGHLFIVDSRKMNKSFSVVQFGCLLLDRITQVPHSPDDMDQ